MQNTSRRIETTPPQPPEKTTKYIESSIIPLSFMLGGLTVSVELDNTLVSSKRMLGEARYMEQLIHLDASIGKKQLIEQTYYHELVHWILYVMNEDELRNNEKFVDVFAQFLYQARVTEQYQSASSVEVGALDKEKPQTLIG
jgi:hypothetical protein